MESLSQDDRLRRFQDLLNEEDDSEFELVSSTKQRLDLLNEEMEDDDIIIVSTKPKIMSGSNADEAYNLKVASFSAVIVIGCLALAIYHWVKKNHASVRSLKRNEEHLQSKSSLQASHPENKTFSKKKPLVDTTSQSKEDMTSTDSIVVEKNKRQSASQLDNLQEMIPALLLGESSPIPSYVRESQIQKDSAVFVKTTAHISSEHALLATDANLLVAAQSSSITTTTSLTNTIRASSDSRIVLQLEQREKKIQSAASQMAQDIKLVEEALLKNGIADYRSLAPSLAVSLHASQQMMESQQELEARRIFLDVHQNHLDRQLSQRQHEESLQAAKYDPNWKEKLERARDKCWDSVSRLLFEVGAAYQLSKSARPLFRLYNNAAGNMLWTQQEVIRLVFSSVSIQCWLRSAACVTSYGVQSNDGLLVALLYAY
jgi:hypothetical protein